MHCNCFLCHLLSLLLLVPEFVKLYLLVTVKLRLELLDVVVAALRLSTRSLEKLENANRCFEAGFKHNCS